MSTLKTPLKDFEINTKFKLLALWVSLMFLYVYGDYFEFYVPNKLEKMISGTSLLDSPTKVFGGSVMTLIPALMISLTLLLRSGLSRSLNIIFGITYTLIVLIVGSTALYTWYTFYVFYALVEAIITINIVRIAWKWPRE